ncbi:unnamed protein product, partial [Caretta caretta]
ARERRHVQGSRRSGAMARGNFADILRNLLPVLRQYESAEENVSNQEV